MTKKELIQLIEEDIINLAYPTVYKGAYGKGTLISDRKHTKYELESLRVSPHYRLLLMMYINTGLGGSFDAIIDLVGLEGVDEILNIFYTDGEIDKYKVQEVSYAYLKALYSTIMGKYDTFMFKHYAHKVDSMVLTALLDFMKVGKNFTRVLDYSKLPKLESYNFLLAMNKGCSLEVSFSLMRYLPYYYHHITEYSVNAYGLREIKNLLLEDDSGEVVFTRSADHHLKMCSRVGADPYLTRDLKCETVTEINYLVAKHTKYEYMSKSSFVYRGYLEDVLGINLSDINIDKYRFKGYALAEACHYGGKDFKHYLSMIDKITPGHIHCIALGHDVDFYLNLGYTQDEEFSVMNAILSSEGVEGNRDAFKYKLSKLLYWKAKTSNIMRFSNY